MNILIINKFLYPRGGDAIIALGTGRLLEERGHRVAFWGMDHPLNPEYPLKENFVTQVDYDKPGGILKQLKTASNLIYSREATRKLKKVLLAEKPDIVHLHNFAHQISPSVLDVLKEFEIPSVMTVHDFKLVCAAYSLLVRGRICEKCAGGRHYHCFLNKCAKNSRTKSLLSTAEMYLHHQILHSYDKINFFISPSKFHLNKIGEMGFKGPMVHLPNFVELDGYMPAYASEEDSIVYFGRLIEEKGLLSLLEAMKEIDGITLKVLGDGPQREVLEARARNLGLENIQFLGYRTGDDLKNEIKKSKFFILPSLCYENNPRSIIEGFALGKPAVASAIGGIPELVKDQITGLTFRAGDVGDLAAKIKFLVKAPDQVEEMGKRARVYVEEELTADKYYQGLMEIYRQARLS